MNGRFQLPKYCHQYTLKIKLMLQQVVRNEFWWREDSFQNQEGEFQLTSHDSHPYISYTLFYC